MGLFECAASLLALRTTGGNGEKPGRGIMEWETWIAEQTEDVRQAYEAHTAGLQAALKAERENGKALKGQLRELTDRAAVGEGDSAKQLATLKAKISEMETASAESAKALEDAHARMAAATRQYAFHKEASSNGVSNPENAFLIAQGKGLIGDDGALDWEAFRKAAPEQFGTTSVGNPPRGTTLTMDDVRRMTPEQYNQNRDAVNAVLAQQRA